MTLEGACYFIHDEPCSEFAKEVNKLGGTCLGYAWRSALELALEQAVSASRRPEYIAPPAINCIGIQFFETVLFLPLLALRCRIKDNPNEMS